MQYQCKAKCIRETCSCRHHDGLVMAQPTAAVLSTSMSAASGGVQSGSDRESTLCSTLTSDSRGPSHVPECHMSRALEDGISTLDLLIYCIFL